MAGSLHANLTLTFSFEQDKEMGASRSEKKEVRVLQSMLGFYLPVLILGAQPGFQIHIIRCVALFSYFQLHRQLLLLNQVGNCFIWLAIGDHANCSKFKSINWNRKAKVVSGQSEDSSLF